MDDGGRTPWETPSSSPSPAIPGCLQGEPGGPLPSTAPLLTLAEVLKPGCLGLLLAETPEAPSAGSVLPPHSSVLEARPWGNRPRRGLSVTGSDRLG